MRDEVFLRGSIPMTKSEVRAVSLSKLEIRPDDIVYDIGAGTGSVSVEAALLAGRGRVYAFEQKEEGCRLIRENARRFRLDNLEVISGCFPTSLPEGLPAPDRIFVGGSGGRLADIVRLLNEKYPSCRVVFNVIALETLAELLRLLSGRTDEPEIVSLQVARAERAGNCHLMRGQNPVYIITVGGEEPS